MKMKNCLIEWKFFIHMEPLTKDIPMKNICLCPTIRLCIKQPLNKGHLYLEDTSTSVLHKEVPLYICVLNNL